MFSALVDICGWNGVVASGVPRVAADESSHRQPATAHRTVALDRLQGVRRTTRVEPADLPVHRADQQAVQLQESDDPAPHGIDPHHDFSNRVRAPSTSAASSSYDAEADDGSARTTARLPAGRSGSRAVSTARRRRWTRFRRTALPTALFTTNPTRGGSAQPSSTSRWRTTARRDARRPERTARRKSSDRRSRFDAGSTRWSPSSRSLRPRGADDPCHGGRR